MLRPRPLAICRPGEPGARLGVFAPSSPFDGSRLERGLVRLAGLGLEPVLHPQVTERQGFLAGPDAHRARAIHELLAGDDVGGLIAARGGYGAHRILRDLDPALIRSAGKMIVGFSDVCAIHAVAQKAGLISIHGPVVTQLGDLGDRDLAVLARVLAGDWQGLEYSADRPAITPGRATGRLAGGCLSVIVPLVGTDLLFFPDDVILLLEDVGEAPYRIDRMLTHLHLAGLLGRTRGIVLGDFAGCASPRAGEQSIEEVLAERLGGLGVPVLAGLPFGHGARNHAVPLGARVTLDASAGVLRVEEA